MKSVEASVLVCRVEINVFREMQLEIDETVHRVVGERILWDVCVNKEMVRKQLC
jgi:hypothetical protein